MAAGDGAYISIAAVQADFALKDKITKSGYASNDIAGAIAEAENFVEGYLAPIGYARADLVKAPAISRICMLYVRYAVMRDIFTNISPSEKEPKVYTKWQWRGSTFCCVNCANPLPDIFFLNHLPAKLTFEIEEKD